MDPPHPLSAEPWLQWWWLSFPVVTAPVTWPLMNGYGTSGSNDLLPPFQAQGRLAAMHRGWSVGASPSFAESLAPTTPVNSSLINVSSVTFWVSHLFPARILMIQWDRKQTQGILSWCRTKGHDNPLVLTLHLHRGPNQGKGRAPTARRPSVIWMPEASF